MQSTWFDDGVVFDDLRQAIAFTFGVDVTDSDWNRLESDQAATLGDLCGTMASLARRPIIQPWGGLGEPCLPAGVLLSLRAFVKQRGIHVDDIRPSMRLTELYSGRFQVLLHAVVMLAPGSLGETEYRASRLVRNLERHTVFHFCGTIVAGAAFVVGAGWGQPAFVRELALLIGAVVAVLIAGIYMRPESVTIRGAGTVGELARLIADDLQRQPSSSSRLASST